MRYSVVVPYFRTPEITRICLYSIYKFARGEPEVIVVDNGPGEKDSSMLKEFSKPELSITLQNCFICAEELQPTYR